MSTVKMFILIVIVFVIVVIILAGTNPFSFGEAYFRPRANSSTAPTQTENVIINDTSTEGIKIDR